MCNETYNKLEAAAQAELDTIEEFEPGSDERKNAVEQAVKLIEKLIAVDKDEADAFDKEKRREIEEKKNESTDQIEKQKQDISWKRAAFEFGKIAIPMVGSAVLYFAALRENERFEESGTWRCKGGRELRIKDVFGFFK